MCGSSHSWVDFPGPADTRPMSIRWQILCEMDLNLDADIFASKISRFELSELT